MSNTTDAKEHRSDAPKPARRGSRWANAALFTLFMAMTVLVIEVGFRLAMGLPMF